MPEIAYSADGSEYHLDLYSVLDELRDGGETAQEVELFRADVERPSHGDFVKADWLIEQAQSAAFDNFGEWSDDYLADMSEEQMAELTNVITNWLNKNVKAPAFYGVKNAVSVTVPIDN